MGNFTFEEMNLMCIYKTDTRQGLIDELAAMRVYIDADSEAELLMLTDSTLEKLRSISDEAFEQMELYPDFEL